MKKNNLQVKTILELQNELRDSLHEQFKLRMQKTINPKEFKSSAFTNLRRLIARIKTIIHQKENTL